MKYLKIILLLINFKYSKPHTWIDSLSCSCPEGNIGYTRGYLGRDDINEFDKYSTHEINCRDPNSLICSTHQSKNFQYKKYPKLICAPGSTVYIHYNPNGHISKDLCVPNDPRGCRGCRGELGPMSYWYIASNKNIYPNELKIRSDIDLNDGLNLNTEYDNKLRNIISYRNSYDVGGNCKEDSKPCKGSFILPTDLKNHTDYQFIFYHVFDRNPFAKHSEAFTSCFSIHIMHNKKCMNKQITIPVPSRCSN